MGMEPTRVYTTEATGEAGTYESVPIDLFMSGLWTLTFSVESGDAVLDETTFKFCMEMPKAGATYC